LADKQPQTEAEYNEAMRQIELKEANCRTMLAEVELSISSACRRARRTGRREDEDDFEELQERQSKLKRSLAALDFARQAIGRKRKELRQQTRRGDEQFFILASRELVPQSLYLAVWDRAHELMRDVQSKNTTTAPLDESGAA